VRSPRCQEQHSDTGYEGAGFHGKLSTHQVFNGVPSGQTRRIAMFRALRRRVNQYATIRLFNAFRTRGRIYPRASPFMTFGPLRAAPYHALPECIAFFQVGNEFFDLADIL
jgi:hypothetical protein